MEYLLVHFREDRGVIVNGQSQGRTETVIELEAGQHIVSLDPPVDYSPSSETIDLQGTTVLSPLEFTFT